MVFPSGSDSVSVVLKLGPPGGAVAFRIRHEHIWSSGLGRGIRSFLRQLLFGEETLQNGDLG